MNNIGAYTKAIAGALGAAGAAAITALQDGHIDGLEWVAIAGAFFVALGAVWAIPNLPTGVARYGKAITAGLVAVAGVMGTALADGSVTQAEWIMLVLAFVNAAQVAIFPNSVESDGGPVSDDWFQEEPAAG